MATAEDIQEARDLIEYSRSELASEKDRAAVAAASSESDVELVLLLKEAERLQAEVEVARADADHQERAVGLLPPAEVTTPDPPAETGDTQTPLPFSGTLYGGSASGDDVTGRD